MSEVKNSDFGAKLAEIWRQIRKTAKKVKTSALKGLTRWLDPKLQPYRAKNTTLNPQKPAQNAPETRENAKMERTTSAQKSALEGSETSLMASSVRKNPEDASDSLKNSSDIPRSREEFLEILHNIPLAVFSASQRKQFEAILSLDFATVDELMLPKGNIVYVDQNEMLGPLTLDRLFRSGMKHFPVTNAGNQIIGCIHTARLNSLDIKQSSKARDILDPNVYYARADYTLEQALEVFLRTESYFLLVVDKFGKVIGILNFTDFASFLFGKLKNDGFLHDDDRLAVAKRHLTQIDTRISNSQHDRTSKNTSDKPRNSATTSRTRLRHG